MRRLRLGLLLGCVVALSSCGGDAPAKDVTGAYTVALTYGKNGCRLVSWREDGDTSSGIPLRLNQDADDRHHVTGTVDGVWGAGLVAWLGSNVFSGTLNGDQVDLEIKGTNSGEQRTCVWTTQARARAFIEGDVIRGEVTYSHATNGTEDCEYRTDCVTEQTFNGTRPPTRGPRR